MDKQHCAEILCVGSEILLGNIVNTNATEISEALSDIGINVYYHSVVGDNPERLRKAVEIARERADIIITTGGLGPTCDDLTKQTLAGVFGLELELRPEEEKRLREYYLGKLGNKSMTDNNLQQAYIPRGAMALRNDFGTAPGCAFEKDGTTVIMLPGPPRECLPMFRNRALPYLRKLSDGEIKSHMIHVFGMGESVMEDKLRTRMLELENPTLAPYAGEGEAKLRVTAKAETEARCEELMAPVIKECTELLGDVVYGIDVPDLETAVFGLLKENGKTVCFAESCTGGLVSKRLTDVPGASEVFAGAIVSYSNEAKMKLLGVSGETLEKYGAVSSQCAEEMAKGARRALGTDYAVALTGLAGPDGDGSGTPVGTVYITLDCEDGTYTRHICINTFRSRLRTIAAHNAFDMIRRHITGLPVIR